jgi:hypothetical protein
MQAVLEAVRAAQRPWWLKDARHAWNAAKNLGRRDADADRENENQDDW